MHTIHVPDDTFARLASAAARLGTTVEQLAASALDQLARDSTPAPLPASPPALAVAPNPSDEWQRRFDRLVAQAAARAHRYPPGFQADVSRESMYAGCGE